MNIAFTGHRPNKLGNDYDFTTPLMQVIRIEIIRQLYLLSIIAPDVDDIPKEVKNHTLIVGMALGIDTLAALIAIEYKIPFIATIPLKGQEKMWPKKSQDKYYEILKEAKLIVNVDTGKEYEHFTDFINEPDGEYASWKMDKRNKWMVDKGDMLIGVWDGTNGGTANCINYAKTIRKPLIHINPLLLKIRS